MSWLDEVLQVGVYLLKCHVSLSLALHKDWEKREGKQGDKRSTAALFMERQKQISWLLVVVVFLAPRRSRIPISSSWQEYLFLGSDQVPSLL